MPAALVNPHGYKGLEHFANVHALGDYVSVRLQDYDFHPALDALCVCVCVCD
jgi:hypothetical protein